jgi:hypothetical protein
MILLPVQSDQYHPNLTPLTPLSTNTDQCHLNPRHLPVLSADSSRYDQESVNPTLIPTKLNSYSMTKRNDGAITGFAGPYVTIRRAHSDQTTYSHSYPTSPMVGMLPKQVI